MRVGSLDHMVINVTDVERSADWYTRALGMTRLDYGTDSDHPRTAVVFSAQRINLRPMTMSKGEWFTADHEAAGSHDLCFLTSSSAQDVIAHLHASGVEVVSGPDQREGARGTLTSVYCRDPDGSLIEISSYQD
ncbi:VOC family protein [Agrobacterium tumefaciens]|uniref:VOC family protein n=1 Tax=Agrobacterium tumefaciens TaxID=358 RepID=UPI0021FCC76F|nr:VOC family protein [Agrobacterium tumefaciens]UXT00243.1 VOC family protein [Agrobacterium tumefaciens]